MVLILQRPRSFHWQLVPYLSFRFLLCIKPFILFGTDSSLGPARKSLHILTCSIREPHGLRRLPVLFVERL